MTDGIEIAERLATKVSDQLSETYSQDFGYELSESQHAFDLTVAGESFGMCIPVSIADVYQIHNITDERIVKMYMNMFETLRDHGVNVF